jgi:hypothetical protein
MAELHEVSFETPETPDPAQAENAGEVAGEEAAPPPSDRPGWLPEKFESPEALAQAYLQLEQRQGSQEVSDNGNPAQIAKPSEQPAAPVFDSERYTQEMIADGALSADSLAELKKAGIPDGMIETHLAGLAAMRDAQVSKLHQIAGGEAQWETMQTWASTNLSEPEIDAFNTALQSGDAGQTEFAMAGLRARFVSNTAGTGIEGSTASQSTNGFDSNAQMVAAMSDPRYTKDPAYRDEVLKQIAGMKL